MILNFFSLSSDLCEEAIKEYRSSEQERLARNRALMSVACERVATDIVEEYTSEESLVTAKLVFRYLTQHSNVP